MAQIDMAASIASKRALKGHLTRALTFLNDVDEGTTLALLKSRYAVFRELFAKFSDVMLNIETNAGKDFEVSKHEDEITEFETVYFETDARFCELIAERETNQSVLMQTRSQNEARTDANVRLPKITLPKFDGTITDWKGYWDLFQSMVDGNASIPPVQKFVYLKTSLVGEPLHMVQSLATSEANYISALRLLKDRYDHDRFLVTAHIKALWDIPVAKAGHCQSLKTIVDVVTKNVAALRSLDEPVDNWNSILYFILLSKLDGESRRQYEGTLVDSKVPAHDDVIKFILNRCMSLNTSDSYERKPTKCLFTGSSKCVVCQNEHKIFKCPVFGDMSPKTRYELIKQKRLCVNCFQSDHIAKKCKNRPCFKCSLKHNTLLHFDAPKISKTVLMDESSNEDKSVMALKTDQVAASLSMTTYRSNEVMLSTAMVRVNKDNGSPEYFRAIIDGGSQISFISKRCVQRLKLKMNRVDQTVSVVGGLSQNFEYFVDLSIHSIHDDYTFGVQCLVIPQIVKDSPEYELPESCLNVLRHLRLADSNFSKGGSFDLLLSNDVFMDVMVSGVVDLPDTQLKALNTKLGWIIRGKLSSPSRSSGCMFAVSDADSQLDDKLEKFWELEHFFLADKGYEDHHEDETFFSKTYFRDLNGRFHVELPFSKLDFDFKHSRSFALKRLQLLENRFQKNHDFRNLYRDFMSEYLRLGHMKAVPHDSYDDPNAYYLPHHGVLKESSSTTKLRVVFDGTSTFSNHDSINSVLHRGPKLQTDQLKLLLRFCGHRIAISADIEKMYRQIWVQEKHHKFQRILWRSEVEMQVLEFELCTVTYGLNSSPFLALRCLRQLADDNLKRFPMSSRVMKNDFYVDNLITGCSSLDSAVKLFEELVSMMSSAGFNLRQWTSNSDSFVDYVKSSNNLMGDHILDDRDFVSVLGVMWNVKSDVISVPISFRSSSGVTKRTILSEMAQIYDPLGFLSPSLLIGKLLLQRLWLDKFDWDDPVDGQTIEIWDEFRRQISILSEMKLNRYVGETSELRVFGFGDASMKAYGCCIYVTDGNRSRLVMSRSRVAPLKPITVARLELCAAVLLAKAMNIVREQFKVSKDRCYLFSDSKIVLAWLSKPARFWKTFVANRVADIQDQFSRKNWQHVSTNENPADCVSRGMYPNDLFRSELWWAGLVWIKNKHWEHESECFETELDLKTPTALSFCVTSIDAYQRFSTYRKMVNVHAYTWRFVSNSRTTKSNRRVGILSVDELDAGLRIIVLSVQQEHFRQVIEDLKTRKTLKGSCSLLSLNPFLDDRKLLRAGGRLKNSDLNYATKHPIILPSKDQFVTALIRYEHFRNHHCGVDSVMTILRQKFWILRARSSIRRVLSQCVVCLRFRPSFSRQLMGDLPSDRFTHVRPFYVTGVDYCGPFSTRALRRRGNITVKSYVCVFVCFSTRAVHLELASDMSTHTFLAAFRRFISRRGIPKSVYSDNGTNFRGAVNQMRSWYEKLMSKEFENDVLKVLAEESITWRFIPARSPEFGGIWESAVKVMKACLLKTVGDQRLTIEEFITLFTQIESSMNSRPSCYNAEINEVLTPGHFLIGDFLKAAPDNSIDNFTGSLTKRFCYIQKMFHGYWRRWQNEYLTDLQIRQKNKKIIDNVKVGELVIVKDDNLPPLKWHSGVITELFPGNDGLVRVAKIKTKSGVISREINRLCRLKIFSSD